MTEALNPAAVYAGQIREHFEGTVLVVMVDATEAGPRAIVGGGYDSPVDLMMAVSGAVELARKAFAAKVQECDCEGCAANHARYEAAAAGWVKATGICASDDFVPHGSVQ